MRRLIFLCALVLSAAVSPAATITFSGAKTGSSTAPYTEAGFTVSVLSGAVFYNLGSVGRYVGGDEVLGGGRMGITASNGSAFTFSGLGYSAFFYDAAYTGFPGTQTLVVQGYRQNLLVATQTYTVANTNDYRFTRETAGSLDGLTVDQLTLNLQAGISADYQVQYAENIANIIVNPTATPTVTPEPASIALLGTGLLGVATVRRRFTE